MKARLNSLKKLNKELDKIELQFLRLKKEAEEIDKELEELGVRNNGDV